MFYVMEVRACPVIAHRISYCSIYESGQALGVLDPHNVTKGMCHLLKASVPTPGRRHRWYQLLLTVFWEENCTRSWEKAVVQVRQVEVKVVISRR